MTGTFRKTADTCSQGALQIGHSVTYDVHANWKLVFQNYSECLTPHTT